MRGTEQEWELGPGEREVEEELVRAAHAAPPPRMSLDARSRALAATGDRGAATAGIGMLGATAVLLALVMVLGVGGVYLGSLSIPPGASPDTSGVPAASPSSETPGPRPTPTDEATRASSSPGPAVEPSDDAPPASDPEITASPTPTPVATEDDGPPPGVSPGGPPSPMPGPPDSVP